ncbi:uncharacterized protein RJT21DRAFT_54707 [Scheffersomyces amazonensis]|uniref:uncharacterized protein n=1 Tax=Scheffersomyces amazonensis TaxID=1078765 RepID=UPI00315D2847
MTSIPPSSSGPGTNSESPDPIVYKPSTIVTIFLTKFDVKKGYNLVWYKSSIPDFDIDGLDYKVMPSGIQNMEQSTVLISHYSNSKLYYGLGCFRQIITETHDHELNQIDRNDVHMYSIGILCDPIGSPNDNKGNSTNYGSIPEPSWKPNEFISNGWEYIDILDSSLLNYIQSDDKQLDIFDKLYTKLVTSPDRLFTNSFSSPPSSSNLISPNINNHLLTKLPDMLQTLGPLIFIVYKQALLRKKLLIFNQLHQQKSQNDDNNDDNDNDDDDDDETNSANDDTNYIINSFNYLISLLSIVPQEIKTISSEQTQSHSFSQPIYNIGLNDMNTPKDHKSLIDLKAFVGSTNDDILLYQKGLYDIAVVINAETQDNIKVVKSEDIQNYKDSRIKATLKDYQKFKLIYQELFNSANDRPSVTVTDPSLHSEQVIDNSTIPTGRSLSTSSKFPKNKIFTNISNMSTDDLNSIMTNKSSETIPTPNPESIELKNYYNSKWEIEPEWWLKYATESVSWRESIWSAFSWFATAGQVEGQSSLSTLKQQLEANTTTNIDLMELIQIVGYFHKLTKKWFYLINELVMDQVDQLKDFDDTEETHENILSEDHDTLLQSDNINKKFSIELTYQDIVEMELDPYSESDIEFVKDFVVLYWGSVVDKVDIGIGIGSICC